MFPVIALIVLVGLWLAWGLGGARRELHGCSPVPRPRLRFGQALCAQPHLRVVAAFRQRLSSPLFAAKRVLASVLFSPDLLGRCWRGSSSVGDAFEALVADSRRRLDQSLQLVEYGLVRPHFLPVGGYAGKRSANSPRIIVGLEQWLMRGRLWPWRRSATDHELLHCVQQAFNHALDLEWLCGHGPLEDLPKRARLLWYEFQATVLGSPMVLFSFAVVFGWPALLYVVR